MKRSIRTLIACIAAISFVACSEGVGPGGGSGQGCTGTCADELLPQSVPALPRPQSLASFATLTPRDTLPLGVRQLKEFSPVVVSATAATQLNWEGHPCIQFLTALTTWGNTCTNPSVSTENWTYRGPSSGTYPIAQVPSQNIQPHGPHRFNLVKNVAHVTMPAWNVGQTRSVYPLSGSNEAPGNWRDGSPVADTVWVQSSLANPWEFYMYMGAVQKMPYVRLRRYWQLVGIPEVADPGVLFSQSNTVRTGSDETRLASFGKTVKIGFDLSVSGAKGGATVGGGFNFSETTTQSFSTEVRLWTETDETKTRAFTPAEDECIVFAVFGLVDELQVVDSLGNSWTDPVIAIDQTSLTTTNVSAIYTSTTRFPLPPSGVCL